MYGKIFEQIYDSSIAEDWQVRVVFQDMIILADENGVVDRTVEAISRRTNVPLEVVTKAVEALQKPDPTSRSPEEKGARIKLLDEHRNWGWEIINYAYYRSISFAIQKRERTRLRTRKWRSSSKKRTPASHSVTLRHSTASASAYVQGVRGVGEEGVKSTLNPTWEMCLGWLSKVKAAGADYTEAETRGAFLALSAGGWMWGNRPVADYRAALERQIQTDRQRPKTNGYTTNQRHNSENPRNIGTCTPVTNYGEAARRKSAQVVRKMDPNETSPRAGTT